MVNYDELKVPEYTLPALLRMQDGTSISEAAQWPRRRQEILGLYTEYVFGVVPREDFSITAVEQESAAVFSGTGVRKQIAVTVLANDKDLTFHILMYLPKSNRPVPAFMGLNFHGNHTVQDDPAIFITNSWVRDSEYSNEHTASEKGRGTLKSRWPVKDIVDRGYALITVYYGDLDPDFDDGFENGVHALFNSDGQQRSQKNEWAAIAAWSWGLRRVMDYCESDSLIDHERIAVMGHSRLGKASLWAGAQDERFALVISNDSGCGGAALSRRCFGETIGIINQYFPHWFCANHHAYNENEQNLPVDQHMLIALQAPRPVYVASAIEDEWADPKGEFLSAYHAGEAYTLLGKQALPQSEQPNVDQSISGDIGYHVRSGGHGVTDFDWQAYMDFSDRYLK